MMKKELNILIAGTVIWCAGFVLAPLTEGSTVAAVIYRMYSVVCHQFESRSFHLNGEPMAVCIRCSSIYLAFLLMLILLRFFTILRRTKVNTLTLLGITAIPMAIDGLLSLTGIFQSNEMSRVATGSLFGIGMAWLLHQPLTETVHLLFFKEKISP